jgi:hypothetical protein
MKNSIVLAALIVLAAIAIIYTWIPSRFPIPDGFTDASNNPVSGTSHAERSKDSKDSKGSEVEVTEVTPPFSTAPIDNVDDYEYNMVFGNENEREITKATRDTLMSQYPMDWSVQPASSELFAQGLAAYKEGFAQQGQEQGQKQGLKSPYTVIDGSKFLPPDTKGAEMNERDALQTYKPKNPQSLTTYDADDAREVVQKIYAAKGLIADMKETAPNVFTITSTRPANEKPIFEDDQALTSSTAVESAGENTIVVPAIPSQNQMDGLDPFFTPGEKTRDGKWDYTRWTPGLERSFAPNIPLKQWY